MTQTLDMPPINPEQADNGYALVEVLAASLIISLAVAGFLSVVHTSLSRLSQNRFENQALTLAQSLVEEARNQPLDWAKSGTTKSGLVWQVQNSPFVSGTSPLPLQTPSLVHIRVEVNWQGVSKRQQIAFDTLRPHNQMEQPE